jgi:hypothetical protein
VINLRSPGTTGLRTEDRVYQAAKFQFERIAREFWQSRSVPEEDRSPAPAWWWQPANEVLAQHE